MVNGEKLRAVNKNLNAKLITELQSVTCHVGSHSVTCHLTQVNLPLLTQPDRPLLDLHTPKE